jgi:bile acid:Na+ symporter, BASS family
MLMAALDFLGRHATRFLAVGAFVGLAVPPLADLVRPLLIPVLLVPLTISLLRLDWRALAAYGRRPLLIAAIAAWLLLVCPLAVWAIARATALPPGLVTAVVLMAAAPPIVSSPAIALFLGLDAALAVVVVLATTALVPFTLPPLALGLLGLDIAIGRLEFMLRLGAFVGFALTVALIARRALGTEWLARHGRALDGISVINLVLFVIGIMAGVTDVILERPLFVAMVLAVAVAANVALQIAGALVAWPLGRPAALALGWMTGNCNMGMVLVTLADKAEFDVILYFAVAQIPMYVLPGLLTPLYRRLLREKTGAAA